MAVQRTVGYLRSQGRFEVNLFVDPLQMAQELWRIRRNLRQGKSA